jgi:hypothetical protein
VSSLESLQRGRIASYMCALCACRWVVAVKEMREVFARLEAQGYPRDRQEVSATTSDGMQRGAILSSNHHVSCSVHPYITCCFQCRDLLEALGEHLESIH